MGADPEVFVWFGIKIEENFFEKSELPQLSQEQENAIDSFQGLKIEGLRFEYFYCSEDKVGFGHKLLGHDWNDGVKELNLQELLDQSIRVMPIVERIMPTLGVTTKPKVYIQTDYS